MYHYILYVVINYMCVTYICNNIIIFLLIYISIKKFSHYTSTVEFTLTMKSLTLGYSVIKLWKDHAPCIRGNAVATRTSPELSDVHLRLSGAPGRLEAKSSRLPALSPFR